MKTNKNLLKENNEQKIADIDINEKTPEKNTEEKIDDELDQSFPASDPPSYSQPGNDDILPGKKDLK